MENDNFIPVGESIYMFLYKWLMSRKGHRKARWKKKWSRFLKDV